MYLATYRGYNPFTARWLNRDPIEENGGLNLYEYVGGDPVTNIDPLGLSVMAGVGGIFYESYSFLSGGEFNACMVYDAFKDGYDGDIYDISDVLYEDSVALFGIATLFWNYEKYMKGYEYVIGKNIRIAPWGNRTNNKYGKWPHYHRRGKPGIDGKTLPGQGIGRHRPYQPSEHDKHFVDRF